MTDPKQKLKEMLLPQSKIETGYRGDGGVIASTFLNQDAEHRGYNRALKDVSARIDALSPERVYGMNPELAEFIQWDEQPRAGDTHSAIILCKEPIKKGVSKSEIDSVVTENSCDPSYESCYRRSQEILLRIKKEGMCD